MRLVICRENDPSRGLSGIYPNRPAFEGDMYVVREVEEYSSVLRVCYLFVQSGHGLPRPGISFASCLREMPQ